MGSQLELFRNHALAMAGRSVVPAREAALWLQLADEIDAYLTADDQPLEGL